MSITMTITMTSFRPFSPVVIDVNFGHDYFAFVFLDDGFELGTEEFTRTAPSRVEIHDHRK